MDRAVDRVLSRASSLPDLGLDEAVVRGGGALAAEDAVGVASMTKVV
jgi:hypothetical protein